MQDVEFCNSNALRCKAWSFVGPTPSDVSLACISTVDMARKIYLEKVFIESIWRETHVSMGGPIDH
jgi:hypothetical protein